MEASISDAAVCSKVFLETEACLPPADGSSFPFSLSGSSPADGSAFSFPVPSASSRVLDSSEPDLPWNRPGIFFSKRSRPSCRAAVRTVFSEKISPARSDPILLPAGTFHSGISRSVRSSCRYSNGKPARSPRIAPYMLHSFS